MAESDFTQSMDPFALFGKWLEEAEQVEMNDPNAMSVATVDENGLPDVRILLLKGWDENGFVFYTNMQSEKGKQLKAVPKVALCFHWKSLRRQIRVRGAVSPVSDEAADVYFSSRSEGSRIGAWASQQSSPLESRAYLEAQVSEYEAKYAGENIPRPPHWTGSCLAPVSIEFWQERPYRLHDRIQFSRQDVTMNAWQKERLYP